MEWQQMAEWLRAQRTRWVIDASHPYAEVVSQNIVRACASVGFCSAAIKGRSS